MASNQTYKNLLFVALLFPFYLIISLPILHAGFYTDDLYYSLVKGIVELSHGNIWSFTAAQNHGWMFNIGRLFPLNLFTQYPLEYFFYSPFPYQCVRVGLIWLSFICVAWFIYTLTRNIKVSLLFLFILPALLALELFLDPLTSFGGIFPFLAATIFLSLTFFTLLLQTSSGWKKACYLIFSLLFYALSLLTYEIAIGTMLAIIILGRTAKAQKKSFLLSLIPFILITFIYLGTYFWLYSHAVGAHYDGTEVTHLTIKTLKAFLYQLTSPLPLIHAILHGHFLNLTIFSSYFENPFSFLIIILAFCFSFFSLKALLPHLTLDQQSKTSFLSIGLTFNILPALLIGTSQKYQSGIPISWGAGYLPIYIQYIGLALIFLSLFSRLNKKYYTALAFCISIITCLTIIFNAYVVKIYNELWQQNKRDLIVETIHSGLLNNLPENAILLTSSEAWNIPAFYMQYGHKKLDTTTLSTLTQMPSQARDMPLFLLDAHNIPYSTSGYVLIARVTDTHNALTILNPTICFNLPHPEDSEKTTKMLQIYSPAIIVNKPSAPCIDLQGKYLVPTSIISIRK